MSEIVSSSYCYLYFYYFYFFHLKFFLGAKWIACTKMVQKAGAINIFVSLDAKTSQVNSLKY